MSSELSDLLEGPVGTIVRVAAVLVGVSVLVWMLTGVSLFDDSDEDAKPKPPRMARRMVLGVVLLAVLAAVAASPAEVVGRLVDWVGGLLGGQ